MHLHDEGLEEMGMTLEVRPPSPAFGADVRGVDRSRAQELVVVEAVHAAWERYAVPCVRDQRLDIEDQRRIAVRGGRPAAYRDRRRARV